jgi:hypothetical protein
MHSIYLCHAGHEDDAYYVDPLIARLGEQLVGHTADEDTPIGDAEVMIVVVGEHTWRDGQVAAELAKALELRGDDPRCAVMGLLLPSYDYPGLSRRQPHGQENLHATDPREDRYWACNVPRALADNIESGFAHMRPFTKKAETLHEWIHVAAALRTKGRAVAPEQHTTTYDPDALGWSPSGPEGVVNGAVNVRK